MPRWAKVLLGVVGALVLLLGIGVFIFTQTDYGRERVRRLAIDQLAGSVHGNVRIGKVRGNLLTGATLEDVVITDSAGAPFLRADEVWINYSLRSLFSQRIYMSELRLTRPTIVLDQRPGEEWNFARIFPSDTTPQDTTQQGFGSWVHIENLVVHDGRLVVRNEWQPDSVLTGAARDRAIREALSPEGRLWVVEVRGGYQRIQDYRDLNARLPFLRLADPDSASIRADIAQLSTVALPFRPPAAVVRSLAGRVIVSDDSLHFQNLQIALPGSRLAGSATLARETSDLRAALRAAPLALADLQWIYPALPDGGGGTLQLAATRRGERTRVLARDVDLTIEEAQLAGHADVQFGDSLRLGDTNIRFASVDTRLVERLAPEVDVPVSGTASGHVVLAGVPTELRVDGQVAFRERTGATSRVVADGVIGTGDAFRAEHLRLRFDPVQVSLARAFQPDLPVGGVITGEAVLNGSTATRLAVNADVVHRDPQTGRSRLLANGEVQTADNLVMRDLVLRFQPLQVALARAFAPDLPIAGTITGRATVNGSPDTRIAADVDLLHRAPTGVSRVIGDTRVAFGEPMSFNVDLRAPTLSLATIGRFAPAAELQGDAAGTLRARGTLADLALALDLAVEGGGRIDARGSFNLASERKRYDVRARLTDFDAGALTTRAPHTVLTGTVTAEGRGTDPATMNAVLSANLTDAQFDSAGVDAARVLVRLADGLATFEQGRVQLASAQAEVEGSFGLVAGRSGTLRYQVSVDSLADFAEYLPGDTGSVQPRPAEQQRRLGLAREDSLRLAKATEVERAATGRPPEPVLRADTFPDLRRDSVAGQIRAEGILAGNLERFDLRGTAELAQVVLAGNAVRSGRAEYEWLGGGTEDPRISLTAGLDSVRTGGFLLDSASVQVAHTGGTDPGMGTAQITVYQDPARDYRLRADYRLALDRKEVRFDDMLLRFDTTRWTSTQPGVVSWGETGVEVETLDLRNNTGGHILVDGRLPLEGTADLRVNIEGLQVGDVAALLQDTAQVSGILSLQADIEGTARAPRLAGETSLTDAVYGGTALPTLRARFDYANTELEAHAELLRQGGTLVVADATLPVNLALEGYEGPRLLDRPLRVDIRADSLPLDALPQFTDAVEDVRGRVRGNVAVRGTFEEPDVNGTLDLDLGSLDLVQPGVELRDIAGTLHLRRDSVFVDSLIARSDDGPIRLSGALDISTPTAPSFDLALVAENATVLDNEIGRNVEANADLKIQGPFDRVRVTGAVYIDQGTFYIPESNEQLVDLDDPALARAIDTLSVSPGVLPEENPLLRNLQVEVDVRIARNTWVRNTDANVEIYTPDDADALQVRMDRRSESLTLDGVINTDRGEYNFSGRRFELTSGAVSFLGGAQIDPLLQLTAAYEVPRINREPLIIQINVGGYLSAPRVTLDSNSQPPLPQSDLLAYLAFGRSSSSLLQTNGSSLAGGGEGTGLGALATQQLAGLAIGAVVDQAVSDLENSANRSGLDVFRVQPADLPAEAVFSGRIGNLLRGTEVEAGKYFSRRIFVAAQGRPTNEAWPGVRVEYRTPQGFRWMTTWEPRYQPSEPSFATDLEIAQRRVFGSFLIWERRY
jgi:autotransporter translocation and assembly factor TamB